jgi:hypothetical protein
VNNLIVQTTRSWTDSNRNFVPDCLLTDPNANGECGRMANTDFGGTRLGATYDPELLRGWFRNRYNWEFSVGVQQELFPRTSVEVSYHRRWFTMFTTGGTVTDNELVSPNDVTAITVTAPSDSRLPGGGGYPVGPIYNLNQNVFGRVSNVIKSTKDVGDDTRVFNGVDVQFNVRGNRGLTVSAGTSTGKVVNDWCEIRAAVPESYLLNPYCHVESPWQTSFRSLVAYTIPRIDLLVSAVYNDRPNVGTDQVVSLLANQTLPQVTAPLTPFLPSFTVNLLAPGQLYGPRVRQADISAKKILRFGAQRLTVGVDIYNLANNNVTLAFNPTFVANAAGWQAPTSYMNPRVYRLNAEFAW